MNIRKQDLAWMGGFFDGEGSITLTGDAEKGYLRLEVACSQKVQLPLTIYENAFGGGIYGYQPKRGDVCFVWKIYGANAIEFLQAITPYLVVKGDDAREVTSIWLNHDVERAVKRHEERQVIRREIHRKRNLQTED